MELGLGGKAVLVTGGSKGIGKATAHAMAAEGARVVICSRNQSALDDTARAIKKDTGKDVESIAVDLSTLEGVERAAAEAVRRLGRLDVLVNNAGTTIRKPPDALSIAEWQMVMDTNLTGAFICMHAAYPHMKQAGRGKIINIGSMMSIFGTAYAPAYAASKGGIVQLTRACATAWAKDNIQVNAVLPGWIDTDLTRGARREVAGLNERVLARTPTGRWGEPGDFAGIAVFLASAASDFVTGAAIPVDGGFSVQG
jgi:2-dehydro-3-deoxy-D-gluconate 5-dehydrogenase